MNLVRLIVLSLMLGPSGVWAANEPYRFDNAHQEKRFQQLTHELRCLVCQNQSLADSNADLARDLRDQVYKMVRAGATDEEIVDYMVARYGDFVRYRPPVEPRTYVLWFGPVVLLLLGIVVLLRVVRRPRPLSQGALSEAEHERVRRWLDEPDNK